MKKTMSLILILLLLVGCSKTNEVKEAIANDDVIQTTEESVDAVAEEESTEEDKEKATEDVEDETEEWLSIDYALKELATQNNKLIGACVEPSYLDEAEYAATLSKYFNVLTPENRMKWSFIHPEKDVYAFEEADKIVDFAIANNMKVRGHALVWHIQNPEWLEKEDWTKNELLVILEDHIKTVVGHYKGKVYAWDVVNEAIDNNSYRSSLWYEIIGPDYLDYAFKFAKEADPDALLFINDYMVEEENLKSNFYYEMVSGFIERGIPIDGVGLQFHIDMNTPFDNKSIYSNIQRFSDFGLLIDFTEIDVRMTGEPTAAKLTQQAEIYESLMDIAVSTEAIQSYTLWGFTDKYSWIPGFFSGQGHGLMFPMLLRKSESNY